jgi:hypothetical protein
MRIKRSRAGIGLAVLLAAAPLAAHHSAAAEFDQSKIIKLQGTVTKMEWINPHAWLHIDVKGQDGKVEPWDIESAAPNSLLRRGWTKNSLLPGTEIAVSGWLARDGSKTINGREITFKDGRSMFLSAGDASDPDDKRKP